MATSSPSNPDPNLDSDADDEVDDADEFEDLDSDDDDDYEDLDDDDYDSSFASSGSAAAVEKDRIDAVLRRLTTEPVRIRVHDVVIQGNSKTRRSLIEAELAGAGLARAGTVQELVRAAADAGGRLRRLGAFDAVAITLDAGPPELPGAAVVVVDVTEAASPLAGDFGVYTNPESRSYSLEGSLKLKNLFGWCDTWDTSGSLGLDQTTELSAGVSVSRIGPIPTPLMARASLLSQDWLKFSSYKERLMGISFGLVSTTHHNLAYKLTWRTLTDPSRISSKSARRQLGHSLLSSIKYTYKIDQRDSSLRPTRGYAFLSSSQVGGLAADSRNLRFCRQEFDLRGALPLGVLNGALNVGAAVGVIMPWGRGSMEPTRPLPEQFYLGGNKSLVCCLGGPSSLSGFKTRGLGPTELRRSNPENSEKDGSPTSPEQDVLGGEIAVTAFADLSFDLPTRLLRELGIHGHAFVSAGNLAGLTGSDIRNFSLCEFLQTFRSSAGLGVVVPTKLFRLEINYCHILKQFEHDRGKTGIQFNFSSS